LDRKIILPYKANFTLEVFMHLLFIVLHSRAVVPNLWYAYPWRYAADRLGVCENNIGNGEKHKKKELK
jgi:hypothetical protein